jgi:hypothetical protein
MTNIQKVQARVDDFINNPDAYKTRYTYRSDGKCRAIRGKSFGFNAPAIVDWFKTVRPDIDIKIERYSESRQTRASGMRYFTGGGSRMYCGYTITITVDGNVTIHDTLNRFYTTTNFVKSLTDLAATK